jgi:DNA-binding MarR family transcriptional regulator
LKSTPDLIRQDIIKLSGDIFNTLKPRMPLECLSPEITIAQLRILLLLYTEGPSKMRYIASSLGIAFPSATGIVENLVKKGLVMREADPHDRRLVICCLTDEGTETIRRLWMMGQSQIANMLQGLSTNQLEKILEVTQILFNNIAAAGKAQSEVADGNKNI